MYKQRGIGILSKQRERERERESCIYIHDASLRMDKYSKWLKRVVILIYSQNPLIRQGLSHDNMSEYRFRDIPVVYVTYF